MDSTNPSACDHTRPLALTRDGSIQRCSCCGLLEVQFGNAVFELPEEDLPALSNALARMAEDDVSPDEKRPHVLRPTEEFPVAFVFSESERLEFADLVAHALFDTSIGHVSNVSLRA